MEQEVLAIVSDRDSQARVLQLTNDLLELGRQAREHTACSPEHANGSNDDGVERDTLLEERARLYASKDSMHKGTLIQKLRHVSSLLRQDETSDTRTTHNDEVLEKLLATIDEKLTLLQELTNDMLPWKLRYIADVDPEENGGMITLGGRSITDSKGRNVWADYCGTCDLEIVGNEPRWHCCACVEHGVECEECKRVFDSHSKCNPGVVLEHRHATFSRLEAHSASSLAGTLDRIFHVWGERPCFCEHGGEWLSYNQVYGRVRHIASLLKSKRATQVLLCFPAGSINFYLADLACVLAEITSIGLPVSPPVPIPSDITHVICDERVKDRIEFPVYTQFIDLTTASSFEPCDVPTDQCDSPDSLYTIYYTSGSSGTPKQIPISRQEFLKDFMISGETVPGCCLSFLPPCWATDRMLVYQALYNGWRVGFSRPEPSLPEILEALAELEPTLLVAPPLLLQFMSTLDPPPNLGSRLRQIGSGGAPVGSSIKRFVQETYGLELIEAYGCTECGGIASNERILPSVADSIRIRDTRTRDWLPIEHEGVIGELWVGDFNTQDMVELTEGGTKIRVLGRSDCAAMFKMESGKWCSLVDIEDEIMRTCSPDLVQQALVFPKSRGDIVLVAVVPNATNGNALLLEIRKRVALLPSQFPRAILVTEERLPMTETLKIKRAAAVELFREAAEKVTPVEEPGTSHLDAASIASRVLGSMVDPELSFFENGGDSISAMQFLKQIKLHFGDTAPEWRSLLNEPLSGSPRIGQEDVCTVEPAPAATPTANHILLTGATGFLGRHVLEVLLERDPDTIIVCLVRAASREKVHSSERVVVVTEVPTEFQYRSVIHLAAKVDHMLDYNALKKSNVDMTEYLLRLRLAPMLYCSTFSTREGDPPFRDGYTQTKWVSEQMVLHSGGTCVWPPFLLWGNPRDWLTRLVKQCVEAERYPVPLGFLPSAPVQVCAKELVDGKPCSVWDLDLTELFTLLQSETPMKPVSLPCFVASVSRDPHCAAYPILPLLRGNQIGSARSPSLELLQINMKDIRLLLEKLK